MSADADDPPPLSWQRLRRARASIAERWPSPFRLPLIKRPSDALYGAVMPGDRVLDVGAGDNRRRERVAAIFPDIEYVSVDPDPEAGADHTSMSKVTGEFQVAVLFEVLEHMRPENGVDLLREVHARLDGIVIVSVPCTHTPGRYLRDCTHVTPWAHDELGAALVLAGFDVMSLSRSFAAPALQRLLRRFVLGPVGHLFGLDYAQSVVAVARRA